MIDLTALKDFIDLGGVFILSLILVYILKGAVDKNSEKLDKVLAILYIMVKQTTNFNHISKLLGDDHDKVIEKINNAEFGDPKKTP